MPVLKSFIGERGESPFELSVKRKSHSLVLFLLFLTGAVGILGFRVWQVKRVRDIPFSPRPSSFVLNLPSESLAGRLISVKGKVEKEPREKDKFEEVGVGEEVLQGEKLATGEKSRATVEFPDFIRISLAADSEVDFVSLLPSNFLVHQTLGEVNWKVLQENEPVSVRSLHVLFTFPSGESKVVVEGEKIEVKVLSGEAKFALVNLDNKTHVWELKSGQEALIDNSQRRVEKD